MRRTRTSVVAVWIALAMVGTEGRSLVVSELLAAPPERTMRVIQDLQYFTGPGADPRFHSFDLYLPEGKTNFPVLFFVHGGGWRGGDKDYEGLDKIVRICIDLGMGVMAPNYRLSPAIKHPVHVQDVARAFAWLHQNAAQYGGDRNRIFVMGSSSGGHLAALVSLDERYLKEHGLSPKIINGVILSSGVLYMPYRPGPGGAPNPAWEQIFGSDYEVQKEASPVVHVGKLGRDTPPFLIAYTDNDNYDLLEHARQFYALFVQHRLPAELIQQPGRTHVTKNTGIAERLEGADDVLGPAIHRFLRSVMNGTFAETAGAVWPAAGAPAPPMQVQRDISYYGGPGSDAKFNSLDLYLPEGKANVPLVLYVHGGGWRASDKALSPHIVNMFGRLGIGIASVNYRLSPQVKHPAHIQDVARAFSWVYKNAAQYRIDPNRIVIMGTSAGGHLVALLGLNTEYLAQEGVPPGAIKGVIGISGVYDMVRFAEPGVVPTRKEQGFGTDLAVLQQASPITFVNPKAPPFLITFTDWDLLMIRENALQLYNLLLKQGSPVELVQVPGRTHYNQMEGIGKRQDGIEDALGPAVTRFITNLVRSSEPGTPVANRGRQP